MISPAPLAGPQSSTWEGLMLHTPVRAHRCAVTPRLSVTLDTLPTRRPYYRHELETGWWLIVIRDGIEFGTLIRAYQGRLPAWARRRLYSAFGSVDPFDDPVLAAKLEWWDEEWPVGTSAVSIAEDAYPGLITPWAHAWEVNGPA